MTQAPPLEGFQPCTEREFRDVMSKDNAELRIGNLQYLYRRIPEPKKTNEDLIDDFKCLGWDKSLLKLLDIMDEKIAAFKKEMGNG